jgi:iron complex outermembrane receptor protein
MDASEFKAAGGTDLGSSVNWLEEVTRGGTNSFHSLSAQGGSGNTTFRISGNLRSLDGILKGSGFDQFNTRFNLSTKALNDKLKVDFNASFTDRKSEFSFQEALRYAVTYNPTAPILGENSLFPFNSPQFGGYFETLGLFDSFNPVSIISQNRNDGKKKEFNYGANFGYNLLDNLTVNFRIAQQNTGNRNIQFYPITSFFRGGATSPTRKGRAEIYNDDISFKLYEPYVSFLTSLGSSTNLTLTGGYSYQQNNFESNTTIAGDFPDTQIDYTNRLETSQDLKNAGFIQVSSDASPNEKIIAFFGRANATINDAIFLNASVRREGSTKLGKDNQWGVFPAFGAGVDLTKYANFGGLNVFKIRAGYGVTGSLPIQNGLAQEAYTHNDAANGGVTTTPARKANPNLKWEEKAETNLGIDFGTGRFNGSIDVYQRAIKDFILDVPLDVAVEGFPRQTQNAGKLSTKGLELSLNYDLIRSGSTNYTTGIVFSTYKTILDEYIIPAEMRANLGAPGQNGTNMIRVKVGDEIGNIWGPQFTGVDDKGSPTFADLNGDGLVIASQDKALDPTGDFQILGNGIPDFELGWRNNLEISGWNINAFFRGAFGHSLVNSFRAFYEPQIASQSSYNFMKTSKFVAGLKDARFSSLYVEKGDFLKLDNLTISRRINLGSGAAIKDLNVSLTGQNLLVLTGYTGADPEPNLVDYDSVDNGTAVDYNTPDVLSPGIDRRNNYFNNRAITLGVNFNF